jgi:peroxiredoxin
MIIKVGDELPEATFSVMKDGKPSPLTVAELTKGRKVALFAVPGAFTPTCSARHLPGYKEKAAEFRAKGVDAVAWVSVNDVFVMDAWGKQQGVGEDVLMLADGNGAFAKAVGVEMDRCTPSPRIGNVQRRGCDVVELPTFWFVGRLGFSRLFQINNLDGPPSPDLPPSLAESRRERLQSYVLERSPRPLQGPASATVVDRHALPAG